MTLPVERPEWMAHGACADLRLPPDIVADIFYPREGRTDAARNAKNICRRCPVRDECLEHALVHEMWGVWGGLTPLERRRLRRARGIELPRRPRPGELTEIRRRKVLHLHDLGWSAREIAGELDMHRHSVYRCVEEAG